MISKKIKYRHLITLLLLPILYCFVGVRYLYFVPTMWTDSHPDKQVSMSGPFNNLTVIDLLEVTGDRYEMPNLIWLDAEIREQEQQGYRTVGRSFFPVMGFALLMLLLAMLAKHPVWLLPLSIGMLGIVFWTVWALTGWADPEWRLNSLADNQVQQQAMDLWQDTYVNHPDVHLPGNFMSSSGRRGFFLELSQGFLVCGWLLYLVKNNLHLYLNTLNLRFSTTDVLDAPID